MEAATVRFGYLSLVHELIRPHRHRRGFKMVSAKPLFDNSRSDGGLTTASGISFRSWKRKRLVLRRDVTVARNVAVAQRSYIINSTLAEPSELANRVARVVCKSCQERQHSR